MNTTTTTQTTTIPHHNHAVLPSVLLEVVGNAEQSVLQNALGHKYTLVVWPHAKFGDAVVQLWPLCSLHSAATMRQDLAQLGLEVVAMVWANNPKR